VLDSVVAGGIALGKALQTNRTLKSLIWDRNATRYAGILTFVTTTTTTTKRTG
jgi:hypothetical protein